MLVTSPSLLPLSLDPQRKLLTLQDTYSLMLLHHALDRDHRGGLNFAEFKEFLTTSTTLKTHQVCRLYDMFDITSTGLIDFHEFYLLVCFLIAVKDGTEKLFLGQHARACFDLLDVDASGTITAQEFDQVSFLFNFSKKVTEQVFRDFDVDDSKELDYEEFKMFTLAMIDRHDQLHKSPQVYDRLQRIVCASVAKISGLCQKLVNQKE